jgi:hypothetical protein
MVMEMTTKEAIHQLVDALDEEAANAVLDYVQTLTGEHRLTNDGVADSTTQARPLEWLKVGQPTSEDDPMWRIVGMVGDEFDGPTDVARNHDQYVPDEAEDDDLDEQQAEAAAAFTLDDPLWNIVGIGRSDEQTDVAKFKDEYLAEAFATKNR